MSLIALFFLLGRAFAQLQDAWQSFGLVSAGLSMPQILSTGAKCKAYAKEYVVFGARSGFLVSFP